MILSPLKGNEWRITQKYGARPEYYSQISNGYWQSHSGIDFAGKNPGDKPYIHAPYDLICRKRNDNDPTGYGLMVEMETIPDWDGVKRVLLFAHLDSCDVQVGDKVKLLDKFAVLGTSGNSTAEHLHLELWKEKDGKRLNEDNGNHGRYDFEPYLVNWTN